jgi:hypothetical protein
VYQRSNIGKWVISRSTRHTQNRALVIAFDLLGFIFHTPRAHSVGRSNHIAAVFCWRD